MSSAVAREAGGGGGGLEEKVDNLVARVVGGPPSMVGGVVLGGVLWAQEDVLFGKLEAKYGAAVHPLGYSSEAEAAAGVFRVDASSGLDEGLYLEALVQYHLLWGQSCPSSGAGSGSGSGAGSALFHVPYRRDGGYSSAAEGEEGGTGISALALALRDSGGLLPAHAVTSAPSFGVPPLPTCLSGAAAAAATTEGSREVDMKSDFDRMMYAALRNDMGAEHGLREDLVENSSPAVARAPWTGGPGPRSTVDSSYLSFADLDR